MSVSDFYKHVEKTERKLWMCNCGNCSFSLYEDGEIVCSDCEATQDDTGHHVAIKRWTRKERHPETKEQDQ